MSKTVNHGMAGKMMQLAKAFRSDAGGGWMNTLTGLGVKGRDKGLAAEVHWERLLEIEAENLYSADDIAARVVSLPAELGTRKFIDIQVGDEDGGVDMKDAIDQEMERLQVKEKYRQAWEWANMYGGAGIFIAVNDGKELIEPLSTESLREIKNLTVLTRYELHAHRVNYSIESDNFLMPEFYQLSPRAGGMDGESVQAVHHSRIIRFEGSLLPRRHFEQNNYWHDSVLTRLYRILRSFNTAHDSIASITQDFRVGILKIKNLADIVAAGDAKLLTARIEQMNLCKSTLGSVLLDAEDEDYTNLATTLNGVDQLLDKINERLVAATGMPHTVILGDGAAGTLGGGGESESRQLNEFVAAQQDKKLSKPLNKIIKIIQSQMTGPTKGEELKSLTWEFNPLVERTPEQDVELRNKQAQTDQIYVDKGVLAADEIRESRFGGKKYSIETKVEEDEFEEENIPENEIEEDL